MELKNEGMAIFLTTHNMEEAAKLCDNVALLNDGVIVEYGSPQAICLKHNQIKKYRVRLTRRHNSPSLTKRENNRANRTMDEQRTA